MRVQGTWRRDRQVPIPGDQEQVRCEEPLNLTDTSQRDRPDSERGQNLMIEKYVPNQFPENLKIQQIAPELDALRFLSNFLKLFRVIPKKIHQNQLERVWDLVTHRL